MATAMATVENDVDELCDVTESLGLLRLPYETMVAKEDANIRWKDLTNDAMAIHFMRKYYNPMYYVEEKIFYLFNGVYWKQLSSLL